MNEKRRAPPVKLRVTGLQEAQLSVLTRLEEQAAALRAEAGVPAERCIAQTAPEIVRMKRDHDVRVIEADQEPVGYLAWRDQAPGIAILERLLVEPSYRRFGLATRLLLEIGEKAKEHAIALAVCLCPETDLAAQRFLSKRGFLRSGPLAEGPPLVLEWLEGAGAERLVLGVELWWAEAPGLGSIPGLPAPQPIQ